MKYRMSHINFHININEVKHITFKVAHIVAGFGHGANLSRYNMNEH